jgi:hypothetical protein
MAPKSSKMRKQAKRNAQRKALRKARNLALVTGDVEQDIDPSEAMQYVLDRAVHMLRNAVAGVSDLQPDEVWVETMVGKIPNEWIRLEEDLRKEVTILAARMIDLDLEGRRVALSEAMATLLVPVFDAIFKDLKLTKAQKGRAPQAVRAGLALLEPGERAA